MVMVTISRHFKAVLKVVYFGIFSRQLFTTGAMAWQSGGKSNTQLIDNLRSMYICIYTHIHMFKSVSV